MPLKRLLQRAKYHFAGLSASSISIRLGFDRHYYINGTVALTSWSAVRLHPGESSGGNLEELVHKAGC